MSVQSFQNIKAVNFGTQGIAKVLLGTTQIWPAVVQNVRAGIDLGTTNYAAREREWLDNGLYLDESFATNKLQTISVPAGANILNLIVPNGVGAQFDAGNLWISTSINGDHYGKCIDSNPGSDGDLQARYGGIWQLPTNTKPGDVLYVVVGMYHGTTEKLTVAKIEFKA